MGFESKKLVLRVQQFSLFVAFLLTKIFNPKKGFFKKDKNTAARAKKVGVFVLVQIYVGKKTLFYISSILYLFLFFPGRLRRTGDQKKKKKERKMKKIAFFK